MLGTVLFPGGFDVRDVGDDFVIGSWHDELEVKHVQVYKLDRA